MFTRYTGVDVPQNYSGNRFRKDRYEDTGMKIHSSSTENAVKSSVSPSFENRSDYYANSKINEDVAENDGIYEEVDEHNGENFPEHQQNELDAGNEQNAKGEQADDSKIKSEGVGILKELSPFVEHLKSISRDDLLLIALIIFLASDKKEANGDIIILLALLLIYHT